ncbi:hypothetical protein BFJ66_g16511 [Fusarium oxysporum f. sp. cepae]|nr:hypothetical protein BFJ67_g16370 [Fusarium oxysporum f. sp. cepae]RKK27752.1 hypothetical protein BFJ66_g16511 [Fusarium oxysporum f. sp. cepae]
MRSSTFAPCLPGWKDRSLAAAQRSISLGTGELSSETAFLAMLMSCIPPGTPLEVLRKGADVRKRWNHEGAVGKLKARDLFVHPDIEELLLNPAKLRDAWKCCRVTAGLEPDVPEVLSSFVALSEDCFDADLKLFWSFQALILICGAIPWKSLEPVSMDCSSLTRCLRYTI